MEKATLRFMKGSRAVWFVLLSLLPVWASAQDSMPTTDDVLPAGEEQTQDAAPAVRFGYLSYEEVLKGMSDYADAQDSIQAQRQAYENEIKRVESDFNEKYEAFLEGQHEFPRTILLKRQTELQELMKRNVDFKVQARHDLEEIEKAFMAPVKARLDKILAEVAREFGLALVINTDANACPFIDPQMGMDIQQIVTEYLE